MTDRLVSSSLPNWTDETFVHCDEACDALCADRPGFISQTPIMEYLPPDIKANMRHSDPRAHIPGFSELFVHLNKTSCPQPLRRLVKTYFYNNPPLREHLSQSLVNLLVYMRYT